MTVSFAPKDAKKADIPSVTIESKKAPAPAIIAHGLSACRDRQVLLSIEPSLDYRNKGEAERVLKQYLKDGLYRPLFEELLSQIRTNDYKGAYASMAEIRSNTEPPIRRMVATLEKMGLSADASPDECIKTREYIAYALTLVMGGSPQNIEAYLDPATSREPLSASKTSWNMVALRAVKKGNYAAAEKAISEAYMAVDAMKTGLDMLQPPAQQSAPAERPILLAPETTVPLASDLLASIRDGLVLVNKLDGLVASGEWEAARGAISEFISFRTQFTSTTVPTWVREAESLAKYEGYVGLRTRLALQRSMLEADYTTTLTTLLSNLGADDKERRLLALALGELESNLPKQALVVIDIAAAGAAQSWAGKVRNMINKPLLGQQDIDEAVRFLKGTMITGRPVEAPAEPLKEEVRETKPNFETMYGDLHAEVGRIEEMLSHWSLAGTSDAFLTMIESITPGRYLSPGTWPQVIMRMIRDDGDVQGAIAYLKKHKAEMLDILNAKRQSELEALRRENPERFKSPEPWRGNDGTAS